MPTFGRRMREEVLERITAENAELGAELSELRRYNPQAFRKALRKWGRGRDEVVAWRPTLASTAEMRSAPEADLVVGDGPESRTREVEAPEAKARGESPAEARARLEAENEARRAEAEAARQAKEQTEEAAKGDALAEEKPKGKRGKKAEPASEEPAPEAPEPDAKPKPKGKKKA